MGEIGMTQKSAAETLQMFAEIAPYINGMTSNDMGISVVLDGKYIAYVPAEKLNLGNRVGDPVKGKVSQQCIATGKRTIQVIKREQSAYGVPYVACALPFKDGERVIGCVTTTQTIESQEKITDVSANLASSSEELTAGMEEISAKAAMLAATTDELEQLGTELGQATKKTDEIVAFIRSVAGQTNLLGLNAAIEAARVGEMGRGFGVVAEEVRKLATASADSVKNISQSIQEIQNTIISLTKRIESIDQTVEEQAAAIREIAAASQNLAAMASELSAVAERMFEE
jgi:uncharacterized phage infection (PIP) family protein YhgE